MKELMERLVKVGVEFGVMDRVKGGVRDWSWMVGVNVKEDMEEFIYRVVMGCSLNFNYLEGGVEGLKSEVLWDWVKDGMKVRDLEKFNLVDIRRKLFMDCWYYVNWIYSIGDKLMDVVKEKGFWYGLWREYGEDVCWKRVNLVRMILKESGVEVWEMERKEIVVDYNLLCVMKYMGVIDYKGDFKDEKKEVDKLRLKVFDVVKELLEVSGKDESWLDGLLFFIGRELRKRGLVNVCLYNGCIDY